MSLAVRVVAGGLLLALASPAPAWEAYGGDPGGMRFSPLTAIAPANVAGLEVAWVHHHGDVSDGTGEWKATSAFEVTPILADGRLFYCTPMNRVIALDPASGEELWSFDPGLDPSGRYANQLVCRGVETWLDAARPAGAACRRRIYTATNDARLIALDAASGAPCPDFGEGGTVNLLAGVGEILWHGEYQVTSPPVVVGEVVAVGSAVSDNARTDAPSGVVRGFDLRTGALRWAQDLAPPGTPRPPPGPDGSPRYVLGTPNVWAPMSADRERRLLFVPTGNPAPDYWRGGELQGADHYGSSVVALRAATGEVAWHFQTVHHDLWDYDVPAQPTLGEVPLGGRRVPAVFQATKMGHVFVLDRETGEPLFPVEERPVPRGAAPGEILAPTQPFPLKPPPLSRATLAPEDAWGLLWFDTRWCRKRIAALRNDGIFTPPSLQGSLMFPGNAGGSNWGGVALDPGRDLLFANTMNLPFVVTLYPGEEYEERKAASSAEHAPQRGTPYGLRREALLSPLGLPCSPPPWGELAAIDLASGDVVWQVPLGTVRDLAPVPIPWRLGTPNLGGPLATASGLVFIGAAMDDYLRAFDAASGDELWKGRLPAGGQATPMTYEVAGRQFVVIAAGGHARAGTRLGDALVAFALPAGPAE